jgi:hypothetical protein
MTTTEQAEVMLTEAQMSRPACDLGWRRLDDAAADHDAILENWRGACARLVEVCRERDELHATAREVLRHLAVACRDVSDVRDEMQRRMVQEAKS